LQLWLLLLPATTHVEEIAKSLLWAGDMITKKKREEGNFFQRLRFLKSVIYAGVKGDIMI
jgi:hypothetical protein